MNAAAALLGLSWNAVQAIMDPAVARGPDRRDATAIPHLGIDEKSFEKEHDYITVLTVRHGPRVLDVATERTQTAAGAVLQALPAEQRRGVRAVAADMLPAYATAPAPQRPNAELMHDKFFVAKHLGEAVDQVMQTENKGLKAQDDDRLKGTRQLWLFNKSNLSPQQRRRFEAIRQSGLKRARAWAIKEEFRWFWQYVYSTSAEDFFAQWYARRVRCRLRPIVWVTKMLMRHLPNPLSYFLYRIPNATSEGFNSAIQALKYVVRESVRFRITALASSLYCGSLDLNRSYPANEILEEPRNYAQPWLARS